MALGVSRPNQASFNNACGQLALQLGGDYTLLWEAAASTAGLNSADRSPQS